MSITQAPNILAQIERGDTLTDQAEAILRQALMSGGLTPGQSLTLRALASMLGVSVTPAKDAVSRLIAERVIEWGPRRTALVPPLTIESVNEIYTIRLALEGTAAEAAGGSFDEQSLAELEVTADRLARALTKQDYRNVLAANYEFHFTVYRRSNLPLLVRMIEGLWLRMGPSLNLIYSQLTKRDWGRIGVGFHEEIIEALRKGDSASVRRFIEADLGHGKERFAKSLQTQPLLKAANERD